MNVQNQHDCWPIDIFVKLQFFSRMSDERPTRAVPTRLLDPTYSNPNQAILDLGVESAEIGLETHQLEMELLDPLTELDDDFIYVEGEEVVISRVLPQVEPEVPHLSRELLDEWLCAHLVPSPNLAPYYFLYTSKTYHSRCQQKFKKLVNFAKHVTNTNLFQVVYNMDGFWAEYNRIVQLYPTHGGRLRLIGLIALYLYLTAPVGDPEDTSYVDTTRQYRHFYDDDDHGPADIILAAWIFFSFQFNH